MSGLDKNRQRNCTVCFRATPQEVQMLEARVKASGMPKGKYILESVLHQKISIAVGKYQSDRMSLELQKLRMALESTDGAEQQEVLTECKSLLKSAGNLPTQNWKWNDNGYKKKKSPCICKCKNSKLW